jgi:hypothetical protein
MSTSPTIEKLVAASRTIARELDSQTHYALADLQTAIYSLLVSGMSETDIHDKVRLAAETDRMAASFARTRKLGDWALWSLEAATRIEAQRDVQQASSKEGYNEAKRLYGRDGILHDVDFNVDKNGRLSIERHG